MTATDARAAYVARYDTAQGQDPVDVAERVAILLADYEGEVEIRTVEQFGLVRVFLAEPVPEGEKTKWLSRYAWDETTMLDLVRRFLGDRQ